MSKTDKPPTDGWASEAEPFANSAFEEDELAGRQITLTTRLPPVRLPGEEPVSTPPKPKTPVPPEGPAPLDAWNVDRLKRSTFPRAATAVATGSSSWPPAFWSADPEPAQASEGTLESDGDALALAGRPSHLPPAMDLDTEMAERFALGDFSGALRVAELLLGQDASHQVADDYARESRIKLEGLYTSRIAAHGRTPMLTVDEAELRWFGLDSRVGLILPHIDGQADYEVVISRSGMPRLEALRCLAELVEANVVRLV